MATCVRNYNYVASPCAELAERARAVVVVRDATGDVKWMRREGEGELVPMSLAEACALRRELLADAAMCHSSLVTKYAVVQREHVEVP